MRNKIDLDKYYFNDISFNLLMQRRIHKVLLICSSYDAFMLEEDGRIDEQIFNEYVSLNLRYPPVFIHANSSKKAYEILQNEKIDLIIEMLSTGEIDAFALAHQFKEKHPEIPIVVLTHFSREVSLKLEKEDLSAIDYVFSWLGNTDLLVAIIKLIEDKMNVEYDVNKVGVQTIILVEDSIRFVSLYLPNLYKVVLYQTQEFIVEALNEHQKMLRRRGRPKILLATNYKDALELFEKYNKNLLGIITDISYKKSINDKTEKTKIGIDLARYIKSIDKNIPILMQSSDISNARIAEELNCGFIHKYSKNLNNELKDYVVGNFGFGDFIFVDPISGDKKFVADNLKSMQNLIMTIPDHILEHHTRQDDFSKWLNARALFPIAEMFKSLTLDDFENLNEARKYIYKAISSFRASKARGIIAEFDKEKFDEYLMFSRIGEGSIGGKARGLAFINSLIKKQQLFNKYKNIVITIPRTVVLSTDIFDEFMEQNHLYEFAQEEHSDEEILERFVKAKLPGKIMADIFTFISVVELAIAIRSSSKLEDSYYQPFAGVYTTYMLPIDKEHPENSMAQLSEAIKCVYASVYFNASKAYINATSNLLDEEKMGIILQEVCGSNHDGLLYPTISGVGRSVNFYPLSPELPDDGVVNIAYGLGKYVVDGEKSIRFSPRFPKKILQLSNPEQSLGTTQNRFYGLDMSLTGFCPSTDETINIKKMRLSTGEKDPNFSYVASTYNFQDQTIRDGIFTEGKRIVTFSNILKNNSFPLAKVLDDLLTTGRREMNNHIEIEFAFNLPTKPGKPAIFNFLQIRPVVEKDKSLSIKISDKDKKNCIVYSKSALGNGTINNIKNLVYIKPETFDASKNEILAKELEELNSKIKKKNKNYILIGPGRWGSKDPWLGIPVIWSQISEARVIIESGLENYRIDPSQGTHFFQNLTSFRVGYFTINPFLNDGIYDIEYLNVQHVCFENKHIKHIEFPNSLEVKIDGKTNQGIILKPSSESH